MPHNKRESLIYTVMMCFVMVLWMSVYNVALQYGALNLEVIVAAWIGFPIAYVFAMCCDWFVASRIAKGIAFSYLVKPQDSELKKIICVSGGMVVVMVLIMSLYGACEGAFHTGNWSTVPVNWLISLETSLWRCPCSSLSPAHWYAGYFGPCSPWERCWPERIRDGLIHRSTAANAYAFAASFYAKSPKLSVKIKYACILCKN